MPTTERLTVSFRNKFSWSPKLGEKWPVENLVSTGARANVELQRAVKTTFEQGIERLSRSRQATAAVLQAELAYQSERLGAEIARQIEQSSRQMVGAIERGSADIVESIQHMSAYLGAELCEVRWAVERHTKVSQGILQVLLQSKDNESRQCYEEGVRCYEVGEYDLAKREFDKALEVKPSNYFAYQYLGFVAVTGDRPDEAVRNFDLARKFAGNGYHEALALSHLARSHYASGDLSKAAELARAATEAHAESANFWYEWAAYCVRLGRAEPAIHALRQAIERDWTYWAVVVSDPVFDPIRSEVDRLLDELREREKANALRSLEKLKQAVGTGVEFGLADKIGHQASSLGALAERIRQHNVYVYREITPEATRQHNEIFEIAEAELKKRLFEAQRGLRESKLEWKDRVGEREYSYWRTSGGGRHDDGRWLSELSLTGVGIYSFTAYLIIVIGFLYATEVYESLTPRDTEFSEAFASPAFLAVSFGVPAALTLLTVVAAAVMRKMEKNYQAEKAKLNGSYGRKIEELKAEIARLEKFIEMSKKKQYI